MENRVCVCVCVTSSLSTVAAGRTDSCFVFSECSLMRSKAIWGHWTPDEEKQEVPSSRPGRTHACTRTHAHTEALTAIHYIWPRQGPKNQLLEKEALCACESIGAGQTDGRADFYLERGWLCLIYRKATGHMSRVSQTSQQIKYTVPSSLN